MTNQGLVVAIVLGAAVIAVWLDWRPAARMPRSGRRIVLHMLAALVATALVPLPMILLETNESPTRALLALFAFVLPVFVYDFLASIWLLKLLQSLLRTS